MLILNHNMNLEERLETKAVKAAINKKWLLAIKTNLLLLKKQSKNIAALNRLAWAYSELGKSKLAKSTCRKVIKIDPGNQIANKNLKRLSSLTGKRLIPLKKTVPPANLFLEEAGKTKVVSLSRLAPPKVLVSLSCAEPVQLTPKKYLISVLDFNQRYLGSLPDDLSFRLLKFIKGGNQYQAWIKSVSRNQLAIFIRETQRHERFKNSPSFLSSAKKDSSSSPLDFLPSKEE